MPLLEEFGTTSNKYLKSSDFDGEIVFEVASVEKIKANDPDYGATDKDYLCSQNILEEGETFRYTFLANGEEKIYDTKSAVFFIAFKSAKLETGDRVKITRSGQGKDTNYEIVKI